MTRQIHEQQQAVVTSTQAVIATLRGAIPTHGADTQKLLDSVTLNRTLQDLVQSLNQFASRIPPSGAGETPSDSSMSDESRETEKARLRVFKEDLAA